MIRHNKRPIKRNTGEDKYEQEGGPTFMITTAAAVREVCVVEEDILREGEKADDKGKREKRQAADDRAKKKRKINDKEDSGGGEEYAVAPSIGKIGRVSGSISDSDKVGFKRWEIAKSRRCRISSDSKNGSKRNSGG